jgi:hypothetical protein
VDIAWRSDIDVEFEFAYFSIPRSVFEEVEREQIFVKPRHLLEIKSGDNILDKSIEEVIEKPAKPIENVIIDEKPDNFCTVCGNELLDNSTFCDECGSKV